MEDFFRIIGIVTIALLSVAVILRLCYGDKWLWRGTKFFLLGPALLKSSKKLADELPAGVKKDTLAEVGTFTFLRLTKIGMIGALIAILPTVVLLSQNRLFKIQNEKIETQNDRIEVQTYLLEAERRSSIVFMLDGLFQRISNELIQDYNDDNVRNLSTETIAQITSLTQRLKPYNFLENGDLLEDKLSPERGQLLLFLIELNLDPNEYIRIFNRANFSYSDLRDVEIMNFDFDKAELYGSDFSNTKLKNVIFRDCGMTVIDLGGKKYLESRELGQAPIPSSLDLEKGEHYLLAYSDSESVVFDNSLMNNVLFESCMMQGSSFKNVHFNSCDFYQCNLYLSDFRNSVLNEVAMSSFLYDDYPNVEELVLNVDSCYMSEVLLDSEVDFNEKFGMLLDYDKLEKDTTSVLEIANGISDNKFVRVLQDFSY